MTAPTVTESALDRLRRHLERALNEEYKLTSCEPDETRAIREQQALHIKFAASEIHIDSEFEALIPALTIGEREQLRKNLKAEGIRDALVLWLTPAGELVLVDGHNRLSIATADGLMFDVTVKDFANRDEARDWMLDNQLGRRNLTKEQRGYLLGKYFQAAKGSHGGAREEGAAAGRTAERIAESQGVSASQVKRADQYAEAVDRIGDASPEAKDKILTGQADLTQGELQALHDAPDDVIESVAQSIVAPPAEAPAETGTLTLALIACSAEKLTQLGPVPARELYQGDLFKKSVAWAELQGYTWAVLSAKHGLVEPDTELEPYDFSIKDLSDTEAWQWMTQVTQQLKTLLESAGITPSKQIKIVMLAGGAYCEAGTLIHRLRNVYQVETPLKGLGGIGQQKQWLAEQLRAAGAPEAQAAADSAPAENAPLPFDPAEPPAAAEAPISPGDGLDDDVRARAYLEGVAENDPAMFALALERVIKAKPPSLSTLWAWALAHHTDRLSIQDLTRLEMLYKAMSAARPYLMPPADLQLCQTHKQAKPHWVIAGEKPALCSSTYVRNWQEVKEPGQKICELCETLKPAYETELEPYILNTSVALAYLARQQPEALPRALEQVLTAAHALAEAAIDYVTESAEGAVTPAWLELVLKRSNIHRIQDATEAS